MALKQLAAIMFSDIAGFTTLMGEDEARALDLLHQNRDIHVKMIRHFEGELVKEMGDGILANFDSAYNAVLCAGAIQTRTAEIEGLNVSVGIHLGETIFDRGDILGDGVNVASRIEGIADGGEILVSESIRNVVKNQSGIRMEFKGSRELKNVEAPVNVYSVEVEKQLVEIPESKSGGKFVSGKIFLMLFSLALFAAFLLLFALNRQVLFLATLKVLIVSTALLCVLFYLLGFILKRESNRRLEVFIIQINERSGFEALFSIFIREAISFFDRLRSSKGFHVNFFIFSFFVNSFSLFLTSFFVEFIAGGSIRDAYQSLITFPMYRSVQNALIGHITAGVLCSLFDILSFHVTYRILLWAKKAKSSLQEFFRVLFDMIVAVSIIAIIVILIPFFNWKLFNAQVWASYAQAWSTTFPNFEDIFNAVLIAVSSVFPTVIYLMLAAVIVLLKSSPAFVTRFLNAILTNLARDKKPVFGNLAYAMGVVTGFLVLILLMFEVS